MRRSRAGVLLVLLVAFGALGFGGWLWLRGAPADRPEPTAQQDASTPVLRPLPPPPASTPQAAAETSPSFDIVRVSPAGQAVIAGRAEPGAEVVVKDGATEIARAQADRQGAFVAVPAAPLGEGGRSLSLAARDPDGSEHKGSGEVVVVVPPPAPAAARSPAPTEATAVLVPHVGAPQVLQGGTRAESAVGLDTVDYDDHGNIRFTGHAAPGSAIRVYVDNGPVGDTASDAGGHWMLSPGDAVAQGLHTLRVDRLDGGGRVLARVELPFQRAALPAAEVAGERVVVQPGQNLWRLAQAAYGSGVRYTVIFLANRDHIRDPRLIYPGQAFAVPVGP